MSKNYIVGFPRIGEQRELKKALEAYWSGKSSLDEVNAVASELKKRHWLYQKDAGVDYISSNDFSFYDTMLDTAVMLGAIPKRFRHLEGEERYFAMARGSKNAVAMEMTKWFNTNYHYIVPELSLEDEYALNATKLINEYQEAKELGIATKINLIGPITFLALSKRSDQGNPLELLDKILPLYEALLARIATLDESVTVQIDEPIFVKDNSDEVLDLIKPSYLRLASVSDSLKIVVMTYFEHASEAVQLLVDTPVWGIGLDFVHGLDNLAVLPFLKQSDKVLIAGVVDGRNIWKNDIDATLELLNTIGESIPSERLITSTSCSLLHVPYSLKYEKKMEAEIKNWLSYAVEKLDELALISQLYFEGVESLNNAQLAAYKANQQAVKERQNSSKIHNPKVAERLEKLEKFERDEAYETRIVKQREKLNYPDLATTTIGSFPQTAQVRQARRAFKQGDIEKEAYEEQMKAYIQESVAFQEAIGLD
ncbi:MAG TPA: 5-methyltetrahydropteroyltriglutamate--homocysteine S-methyltransferase, partial [Campylobacterales bacterium]|nr:5-methyltetrahydropteroyltriglutamate--homocysteine S-methyltransferase [Campylobacterales bacterium]